jgi:P27 family predicted phage terminase small subunit
MGSRGPLPNPSSSESMRGRNTMYRKPGASTAEPLEVEPPDFLRGNARALDFWQQHAPALIRAGRLKPEMAHMLGLVCEQAAEVRQLSEAVAAEGLTLEGPRGPRANPKVRMLASARRDLLSAARGWGLDAGSDARLPAEPLEDEDDPSRVLREFMGGG